MLWFVECLKGGDGIRPGQELDRNNGDIMTQLEKKTVCPLGLSGNVWIPVVNFDMFLSRFFQETCDSSDYT